jgi:hypothetical protein
MLVNEPDLVTTYDEEILDPTIPGQQVSFGTSGHRGSALLFCPIAAPVPEQTAHVLQTLTADLNICLHANRYFTDSQRRSKTI